MTHIKEQPGLRLPLPLPCNVTCSIIYFRRWVMLSGTSITTTLISPLELVHQYRERDGGGGAPKSRREEEKHLDYLVFFSPEPFSSARSF